MGSCAQYFETNGKTLPGLISLDFCCNIGMVGSEFGTYNLNPANLLCCVSTVQAACRTMIWGIFSCHTFGPSVQSKHCLNSVVADLRLSFYEHSIPVYWWLLPAEKRRKAQIISNMFLWHDNVLKQPPQISIQYGTFRA